MKIRTDFVTNSSSSSFIVEKIITFPILEDYKNSIGNDLSFSIETVEKRTENEESPRIFSDFVAYHYLYEGVKPTVSKIFSSKKMQEAFIKFVEEKYKIIIDREKIFNQTDEWRRGYGESAGNDIVSEEDFLYSYLHPVLKAYMKGRSWIDTHDGKWFCEYCIHFVKEQVGSAERRYMYIADEDDSECTGKFFLHLYNAAGKPLLSIDEVSPLLHKIGLSENAIEMMKDREINVIWASGKTRKADMIVYFTQKDLALEDGCPRACPIDKWEEVLKGKKENEYEDFE